MHKPFIMLSNQVSYSAFTFLAKNCGLFQLAFGSSKSSRLTQRAKIINARLVSTSLNASEAHIPSSEAEEVYRGIFPWENNKKLSTYILENGIIYRNGPLVAINKPYGLQIRAPVTKSQQQSTEYKKITQTLNTVLCSTYKGSLDLLLPLLAKHLGFDSLQVVKSTERFSSGVTLLCSEARVAEKIKKCYLQVASSKQMCEEYLALTVGVPKQLHTEAKVVLALQQSKYSGMKQAVITDTTSSNAISRREARVVNVKHDCLEINSSGTASLVKISSSSTSWHFLRVYLASLLSPVLGDNVHGSRVSFKSGQPKPVNPFSHTTQLPMEVPPVLLSELGLSKKHQALIPVHLHLSKLIVPGFIDKQTDLVIQAPISNTFLWSCHKLGIQSRHENVLK